MKKSTHPSDPRKNRPQVTALHSIPVSVTPEKASRRTPLSNKDYEIYHIIKSLSLRVKLMQYFKLGFSLIIW